MDQDTTNQQISQICSTYGMNNTMPKSESNIDKQLSESSRVSHALSCKSGLQELREAVDPNTAAVAEYLFHYMQQAKDLINKGLNISPDNYGQVSNAASEHGKQGLAAGIDLPSLQIHNAFSEQQNMQGMQGLQSLPGLQGLPTRGQSTHQNYQQSQGQRPSMGIIPALTSHQEKFVLPTGFPNFQEILSAPAYQAYQGQVQNQQSYQGHKGIPTQQAHQAYNNSQVQQNFQNYGVLSEGYGMISQDQSGMSQSHSAIPQSQTLMPQSYATMPQVHGNIPQSHGTVPQSQVPTTQGHVAMPQGQAAMTQGLFAMPHGQAVMTQGHLATPKGQAAMTQGHAMLQGHAAMPQGHLATPQGQAAMTQGLVAMPQGQAAMTQCHIATPQGLAAMTQGHAMPQGHAEMPQDHLATPQGQAAMTQGHVMSQGQVEMAQGHVAMSQGQSAMAQGNVMSLGQAPMTKGHGLVPQGYGALSQGQSAIHQLYGSASQGHSSIPTNHVPMSQVQTTTPQGYGATPSTQGAMPQVIMHQSHSAVPQSHTVIPQGHNTMPQSHSATMQQGHSATMQQGHTGMPQTQTAQHKAHNARPHAYNVKQNEHAVQVQTAVAGQHNQQGDMLFPGEDKIETEQEKAMESKYEKSRGALQTSDAIFFTENTLFLSNLGPMKCHDDVYTWLTHVLDECEIFGPPSGVFIKAAEGSEKDGDFYAFVRLSKDSEPKVAMERIKQHQFVPNSVNLQVLTREIVRGLMDISTASKRAKQNTYNPLSEDEKKWRQQQEKKAVPLEDRCCFNTEAIQVSAGVKFSFATPKYLVKGKTIQNNYYNAHFMPGTGNLLDDVLPKAVYKFMTSFLNSNGGILFIGVTADREIVGVPDLHKSLENQAKNVIKSAANEIVPPIRSDQYNISMVRVIQHSQESNEVSKGNHVLVIQVCPSHAEDGMLKLHTSPYGIMYMCKNGRVNALRPGKICQMTEYVLKEKNDAEMKQLATTAEKLRTECCKAVKCYEEVSATAATLDKELQVMSTGHNQQMQAWQLAESTERTLMKQAVENQWGMKDKMQEMSAFDAEAELKKLEHETLEELKAILKRATDFKFHHVD